MPKPIPPPPPQPSMEETQLAVRWTWKLMLAFLLVFVGLSQCYQRDALMMDYGRKSSLEWVLWKAENLNMQKERAHNNGQGKIIWLIGSSILRESFDVKWLNQELEKENSEFRVIKLSMNRGNAGFSFGFLNKIDIQPDDIIIHNISTNDYKTDWLSFSGFASYHLMQLYSPADFWDIKDWTLADQLEQASAMPYSFWANHETYMKGLTKWWIYLADGDIPPKNKPYYHLTHKKLEFEKNIRSNPNSKYYIAKDGFDFSETQFNVVGLEKMANLAKAKDASFALFFIPPRQQYLAEMVHQQALSDFQHYLEHIPHPLFYLPSLPENDYYDLTHPNFRGRETLNQYFLQWLRTKSKGSFPSVSWPIPEYNRRDNTH